MMAERYSCPVCHRPMTGPDEACSGSFTEPKHPTGVRAVLACEECDGRGWVVTGECLEAMSGPTCFRSDCPPCQTPEKISCSKCRPSEQEEE